MQTLSGLVVTFNSEGRIERLLRSMRLCCDEIVAVVDEESRDATFDICSRLADVCLKWHVPLGMQETILEEAHGVCQGDWILHLDDDELISENILPFRQFLLEAPPPYSAFILPRYNLIGDSRHYIASEPWFPDLQKRIWRRGAIEFKEGSVHEEANVRGGMGARHDALQIFHFRYLLQSYERRKARWEKEKLWPCSHDINIHKKGYLYEDYEYEVGEMKEKPLLPFEDYMAEAYKEPIYSKAFKIRSLWERMASEIYDFFQPKRVVDFGCGIGAIIDYLSKRGVVCHGIENAEAAVKYWNNGFTVDKLSVGEPIDFQKSFDLAISTEVGEHLLPGQAPVLVDSLCKASDTILFSAAPPCLCESGHINNREQYVWVEFFRYCGFHLDVGGTQRFRECISDLKGTDAFYLYENIMVFRKWKG